MRVSRHFAVVDATGRILRSGSVTCDASVLERMIACQAGAGEVVASCDERPSADAHYFAQGQIWTRPALVPVLDTAAIRADGQDVARISGMPPGTVAAVRGREIIVDDGVLEISATMPGRYVIDLRAWPHRDVSVEVEVVPCASV